LFSRQARRLKREKVMIIVFCVATLIAAGSFMLLSGAIFPGFAMVGEAATLTFAGSSVIAVASALALDG